MMEPTGHSKYAFAENLGRNVDGHGPKREYLSAKGGMCTVLRAYVVSKVFCVYLPRY